MLRSLRVPLFRSAEAAVAGLKLRGKQCLFEKPVPKAFALEIAGLHRSWLWSRDLVDALGKDAS